MGKCEMIYFELKFPPRWVTPLLPYRLRSWHKKIVCDNEATQTLERAGSEYPDLNGPINVCDEHVHDVELMNSLLELRNSGELDRMIDEAEKGEGHAGTLGA